jgi:hypothetical protein
MLLETIKINNETLEFNKVIYVDAVNGDDNSGNGSENNPYKTITKSYNEAVSGDGIYLKSNKNSNYNDFSSEINKEISFIGEGFNSIMKFTSVRPFQYSKADVNFYRLVLIGDDGDFFKYSTNTVKVYNCIIRMYYGHMSQVSSTYFYNCIFEPGGYTSTWRANDYIENSIMHSFEKKDKYSWGSYGDVCLVKTQVNDEFVHENTSYEGPYSNSYSYTINDKYEVEGLSMSKLGTGTNPDGSQASLGVYGGPFAWGEWNSNKYLFQDNGITKSFDLSAKKWLTIDSTQASYESSGIDNLDNLIQNTTKSFKSTKVSSNTFSKPVNLKSFKTISSIGVI